MLQTDLVTMKLRSGGGEGFKSTGRNGRVASRHEKSPGRNGSDFRLDDWT